MRRKAKDSPQTHVCYMGFCTQHFTRASDLNKVITSSICTLKILRKQESVFWLWDAFGSHRTLSSLHSFAFYYLSLVTGVPFSIPRVFPLVWALVPQTNERAHFCRLSPLLRLFFLFLFSFFFLFFFVTAVLGPVVSSGLLSDFATSPSPSPSPGDSYARSFVGV